MQDVLDIFDMSCIFVMYLSIYFMFSYVIFFLSQLFVSNLI